MRHRQTLRRAAATAIVAPAVLLASGCGSATSTTATPAAGTSLPASPAAAPSTTATPSALVPAANGDLDKAEFIKALKAASAGVTTAHVSMSLSGAGQAMKLDGDAKLDRSNPSMSLQMGLSGMKLQMRVVDKRVYLKGLPNQAAGKWAVFDATSAIGKQLSQAAAQSDPNRMYDLFDKSLATVKKVGTESVDGEQLTKYDLTLDTKAMAGPATAAGAASLPKTVSYSAWIDSKDHLRKVTFALKGITSTITISKYGEPVDITAPPATDVVKGTGS